MLFRSPHPYGSNVRSYLYCEDVAEAFEIILHRGEVGHVYNIGTKKERRVIDVARDICRLFNLDPDKHVKFVEIGLSMTKGTSWMMRS